MRPHGHGGQPGGYSVDDGGGGELDDAIGAAVWTLLNEAARLYRDSPRATGWLNYHLQRYTEPLRVAVAGPAATGKSTLVNAIVGDRIAPVEPADGTRVSTWYQDGPAPRASVYSPHGPARELPIRRVGDRSRVDVGEWQAHHDDRIVVDWPTRALRDAILIDTPSITVLADGQAKPTLEQICGEADALLYLTRQTHGPDVAALQAVQDTPVARATSVNTIVVLARADEIGAGRIDALSSAQQIARRYRRDVHVAPSCQNVVALAGLLAEAGRTLRTAEFEALRTLASVSRTELEEYVLSVDRFVGPSFPVSLDIDVRRGLLDRVGIFGVRLIATLIRQGYDSQPKLAAQLVHRSGLSEIRDSMSQYFTARRHVLKARSALIALETMVLLEPRPGSQRLIADLERILAGAHEFRELRLLAALGTNRITLPDELDADARRLLGGTGITVVERLGLDESAHGSDIHRGLVEALARWQEHAESPVLHAGQRAAARTVIRSCEGMLATVSAATTRR